MQEGRLDALEVFLITTAVLQVREDPELRMHSRDTAGTEGKGPGIRRNLIQPKKKWSGSSGTLLAWWGTRRCVLVGQGPALGA